MELVQSSDWAFRSSNAPKNYGTGLNWSVCSILFTLCGPPASERSWSFSFCVLQVASEKAEVSAALIEYEKDINLLESLYNNNKALFDQHELDIDLRELAEYASRLPFAAGSDQTMGGCRVLRDLDEWLNSINPNLGKKQRPGLKELWKSGDLREKLAVANAKICSIRTRWQVRGAAQVLEADFVDHHHNQMRLLVSTLLLMNVVLGRLDSVHTDTTAQFQQVPAMLQQIIAMLQQGPMRQRSRSLSVHSQVEPLGFNSQTTRVGHHPRLWVHTKAYHSQVVANPTTSIVRPPASRLPNDRQLSVMLTQYGSDSASAGGEQLAGTSLTSSGEPSGSDPHARSDIYWSGRYVCC